MVQYMSKRLLVCMCSKTARFVADNRLSELKKKKITASQNNMLDPSTLTIDSRTFQHMKASLEEKQLKEASSPRIPKDGREINGS
jgi:hypothetical protein